MASHVYEIINIITAISSFKVKKKLVDLNKEDSTKVERIM